MRVRLKGRAAAEFLALHGYTMGAVRMKDILRPHEVRAVKRDRNDLLRWADDGGPA